jgi:uncharacterized protein YgbK (DUF1537 family)
MRMAAAGADVVSEALAWAAPWLPRGPVLVYTTADLTALQAVQQQLGVEAAGALVERTLAAIACGLVRQGVRQLIVAGGETSGACVQALGITQLRIGPQIDPGVPWCYAPDADAGAHGSMPDRRVHIALKSGNFGGDAFFTQAFEALS